MDDGAKLQIGAHHLTREGAILHVRTRGVLSLAEVTQLEQHYEATIAAQGFLLLLIHMEAGTDMSMRARRVASEWGSRRGQCVRSAVYGASFFLRNAIQLLNRASHMLTRNAPRVVFYPTEAEARAWLLEQIPVLTRMPQQVGMK